MPVVLRQDPREVLKPVGTLRVPTSPSALSSRILYASVQIPRIWVICGLYHAHVGYLLLDWVTKWTYGRLPHDTRAGKHWRSTGGPPRNDKWRPRSTRVEMRSSACRLPRWGGVVTYQVEWSLQVGVVGNSGGHVSHEVCRVVGNGGMRSRIPTSPVLPSTHECDFEITFVALPVM